MRVFVSVVSGFVGLVSGCLVALVGIYGLGAMVCFAFMLFALDGSIDNWQQLLSLSAIWPIVLAMAFIFAAAALGAPG